MVSESQFTVENITADKIDAGNAMRLQSWRDTYINEDIGITLEWIAEQNRRQTSDESRAKWLEILSDPKRAGWVAVESSGSIIGMAAPYISDDDVQRVGSLYVAKDWHGKGVGSALMQKIIDWFDDAKPIELEVVSYNERAKAFYRKWRFVEVEGSERLYRDKIPVVRMIRKGGQQ